MQLAKIFIIFTFLLAFTLQVSAQDEKPKIVWENLFEKYERFKDIKPIVKNLSDKPIYLLDSYYSVKIVFFDEHRKEWMTVYPFICGTGLRLKPYKVNSQNDFEIILGQDFWELNTMSYDGLSLIESYRKAEIGRFKLELTYGSKKSFSGSIKSVSPEFQVKIPKS